MEAAFVDNDVCVPTVGVILRTGGGGDFDKVFEINVSPAGRIRRRTTRGTTTATPPSAIIE